MKKWALFVGLLLLMVWGTGCVVIDVDKVHSHSPTPVEPPAAPAVQHT